jgi:hypothetical protein
MDFQTYVAPDYELRSADQLPPIPGSDDRADVDKHFHHVPWLLAVGRPKLVRPKRRAMDYAVGLLLKSPKRLTGKNAVRLFENEQEGLALLGRNALLIAKHVGLLRTMITGGKPYDPYQRESLLEWLGYSAKIQRMFDGRLDPEMSEGHLGFYLLTKPNGTRSMAVRPTSTANALSFHAAQMIARGTAAQTCEHCGTIFLSGGGDPGKDKKRGGSRFCSDECRWQFHNKSRRKAR